jgi:predicted MPP superfamily phosphohydrolase
MKFDALGLLTQNQLKITRQSVEIPHLPSGFEGFRIIQISDLHIYQHTDWHFYERVTHAVNGLKPDWVVLTGDIIHYGPHYVDAAGEFLKTLDAKHGKYACMGNHDYYDESGGERIKSMLVDSGFEVLVNSAQPYRLEDGDTIWLSGLDDIKYGRPNIPQTLSGLPDGDIPHLMLSHHPITVDPVAYYPEKQTHLMLSGHTHAGHLYFPFLNPFYRSFFKLKYRYGRYRVKNTELYLTSGLGSAAVYYYGKDFSMACPRFRFNTWPEIVEITLEKTV